MAAHQSEIFAAALEEAGGDVELVLLPGINQHTSVTDRKVFKAMASYLARLEKADRLNEIGAGTFAFVSNRDGDYEIYLMVIPPVGGGPVVEVQLTQNEADDSVPDWSPDGEKIAFASTRDGGSTGSGGWDIYVMDVDGAMQDPENAEVRRLTDHEGDDLSPVWSSDGTRIAFDSGEGYERDIWVMDADGANQERLVQAAGGWPAWSPDGTRIAYFDRVDGSPEIYVVNVDGSDRTRLTRNSTDDWEPSWSPDGGWLLYVSGGMPDVFMMRADGSETHRLTSDNYEDWSPVWRPGQSPTAAALPPPAMPAPEPPLASLSFTPSGQSLGTAWNWDVALGGMDRGGDLDAFVANDGLDGQGNAIWLKDGQGHFTASSQSLGSSWAVTLGDLDGDGDLDAFETRTHWLDNTPGEPMRIWLNETP